MVTYSYYKNFRISQRRINRENTGYDKMIKRTHVRGTLTPVNANKFKVTEAEKIRDELFNSGLARIMNHAEISNEGRIEINYSYASGMGPNLKEVMFRLKRFLQLKEAEELDLQGNLTVIMDSDDDFPKLHRITVENGTVTCKEGSVTWQGKAA